MCERRDESGDTGDLKDAAKEQCLASARKVTDRQARREAEDACNRIE